MSNAFLGEVLFVRNGRESIRDEDIANSTLADRVPGLQEPACHGQSEVSKVCERASRIHSR